MIKTYFFLLQVEVKKNGTLKVYWGKEQLAHWVLRFSLWTDQSDLQVAVSFNGNNDKYNKLHYLPATGMAFQRKVIK